MKGMVFTEFLELVEHLYSPEMVERIIVLSELPSGGAYTAIGTYDTKELAQLVTQLSRETGTPVPELLHGFGRHLFGRFHTAYPMFFKGRSTALDFLESIEGFIHVEVKKLYPDAELPRFDTRRLGPDTLEMVYRSNRGLAAFASGLIAGCADHFGEVIAIEQEDLSGGRNTEVRFRLTRQTS